MSRIRIGILAGTFAVLPVVVAACGSDESVSETLPPIVTTTSTTTTVAPSSTIPESYVIQPGDTLRKIAVAFNVTEADLIALNGIANPDKIEAGDKLKIPGPGVVIPTAPPVTLGDTTTTV